MRHLSTLPLLGVVLAALAGCAAAPSSRFYILSPVQADSAAPAPGHAATVGVGPIGLPRYLDRPQIAVRNGNYELRYSETHRWAEALRDIVTDVLAENLAVLVPTDRVAVFPWARSLTIDYQVVVDISQFEADAKGNVVLSAYWKLYREGTPEILAMKKTAISETTGGNEYREIVAAQSRALAGLSREIAAAIRTAASR
jgi:uncharacterized lipoprotein YmbA